MKRLSWVRRMKRLLPPLELNLRRLDGEVITVVSTPMPIVFGGQPSVLTAIHDITDQKRGEIELQKARKLLEIHAREIEFLKTRLTERAIHDSEK